MPPADRLGDTALRAIFDAFDFAVFETRADGTAIPAGPAPGWLRNFIPDTPGETRAIRLEETFPFLSGFLVVAEAFQANREPGRLISDIWVQSDAAGTDRALRATALCADNRRFLLMEQPAEEHEARREILQRSRDRALENERLDKRTRELAERNRETERAHRDKSDFLAGMSHDLRTPLNAMLGFTALLLQGRAGDVNEKQRGYLGHVARAAKHLLRLIDDVLELSRIEAGFLDLRPSSFSFGEALSEVVATLAPLAEEKRTAIRQPDFDRTIVADPVRFRQILYNLLSNAIKFTPLDGTVAVGAATRDGELVVSVSDTGPGIAPEQQEAIFTKFYQVRSTNEGPLNVREGSGLGLAIARRLVEQHGGRIQVESSPGSGSIFRFAIPAGESS